MLAKMLPGALAAAVLLAGCEQPAPAPTEPPQPPRWDPPQAPVIAPLPSSEWTIGTEAAGPTLSHDGGGGSGVSDFTLVCATNATFAVVLPGVQTIASEERLSVGVGDQILTLVVGDLSPGAAVRGETELNRSVVETLETGKPIAASYGRHQVGPIALPPPEILRGFANLCRSYMKLD